MQNHSIGSQALRIRLERSWKKEQSNKRLIFLMLTHTLLMLEISKNITRNMWDMVGGVAQIKPV